MARAYMLAGKIVEPGAGAPGAVAAFVAVSFGVSGSRLFKLSGPTTAPRVEELPAATTVDLGRFNRELHEELRPALERIEQLGGPASLAQPSSEWVCGQVLAHLDAQGT